MARKLTPGQKKYAAYLKGEHWRSLHNRLCTDNSCYGCGSPYQLQVHHTCYAHLGYEKAKDLAVLCEDCHGKLHAFLEEKYPGKPTAFQAKRTKEVFRDVFGVDFDGVKALSMHNERLGGLQSKKTIQAEQAPEPAAGAMRDLCRSCQKNLAQRGRQTCERCHYQSKKPVRPPKADWHARRKEPKVKSTARASRAAGYPGLTLHPKALAMMRANRKRQKAAGLQAI